MSEQNVQAIRAAYEALARGDVEAVLACFDRDIVWQAPEVAGLPWAGVHRGREAVAREVFAPALARYEEFEMLPSRYVDAGEYVAVAGRYRGRRAGGEWSAPFVHVWKLRDAKAVRMDDHTGTATAAEVEAGDLERFLERLGVIAY